MLPPVPDKKARISRADPIVGMVFLTIFAFILIFAPQYIGFWDSGHQGFVSILDVTVIKSITGIFILSFVASMIKEIVKLIESRYTIRLMIVTIFCNAVNLVLFIYIIKSFPIWNQNFPEQFFAALKITDFSGPEGNWSFVTGKLFLWVVITGMAIDTLSCIIKTLLYGLNPRKTGGQNE